MNKAAILRYAGPVVGVTIFIFALRLLTQALAGARVRDVMQQVAAIPGTQIALAVLFTTLSFTVLTGYDTLSVRYVRSRIPYRRIALASFLNYSFSQGLGFPLLTGGSVRFRLYSGWGLSALQITNVVAFASFTFWLGVLTVGGLVFLHAPPGVAPLLGLPERSVLPIGVGALAVVVTYLWWTVAGPRLVRIRGWRFRRPSSRLAAGQLVIACIDWTVAGAVLFVLLPEGHGLSFPAFLGVFLLAFVAGIASTVPAGLGVFDTVIVLLLPDHVPESATLGALLAYRGIYFLLPLVTAALLLGVHEALRTRERVARAFGIFARWAPTLAPYVFALTVFIGGAILLASVATPAAAPRFRLLSSIVPLGVIEMAYVVSGLTGVGLAMLAGALERRLRSAWRLSVALLVVGMASTLLKGLDYEEALALALILAALLPSAQYFYRRAALLSDPVAPGWVAAVALAIVGAAWLGTITHRGIVAVTDELGRVAFEADAPRFLRAMAAAIAFAGVVALVRLLQPRPRTPALPDAAEIARARAVVAMGPDPLANRALLGDTRLLWNDAQTAFIPFAVRGRSWVAFGDPVGPREEHGELAWRFRDLAARHGGWPLFYLAGRSDLPIYLDIGLTLVRVSEEAILPLADFTLDDERRAPLRDATARARSAGYTVDVVAATDVSVVLPEIATLSRDWSSGVDATAAPAHERQARRSTEFPFAVVRRDGVVVGQAVLWCGGFRDEVWVEALRLSPDVLPETMDFLLVELIEWARASGFGAFSLGVAPLADPHEGDYATLHDPLDSLAFPLREHFADAAALRTYKDRFVPQWQPRYLASPGGLALPRMMADIAELVAGR